MLFNSNQQIQAQKPAKNHLKLFSSLLVGAALAFLPANMASNAKQATHSPKPAQVKTIFAQQGSPLLVSSLKSGMSLGDSDIKVSGNILYLRIERPQVAGAARMGVSGIIMRALKAADPQAYRQLAKSIKYGKGKNFNKLMDFVVKTGRLNFGERGNKWQDYGMKGGFTWQRKDINEYQWFKIPLEGLEVEIGAGKRGGKGGKKLSRHGNKNRKTEAPKPFFSKNIDKATEDLVKQIEALESVPAEKIRFTSIMLDSSGSVNRAQPEIGYLGEQLQVLPSLKGRISVSALPGMVGDYDNYDQCGLETARQWSMGKGPDNAVFSGDLGIGDMYLRKSTIDSLRAGARKREKLTGVRPSLIAVDFFSNTSDPDLNLLVKAANREKNWHYVDLGKESEKLGTGAENSQRAFRKLVIYTLLKTIVSGGNKSAVPLEDSLAIQSLQGDTSKLKAQGKYFVPYSMSVPACIPTSFSALDFSSSPTRIEASVYDTSSPKIEVDSSITKNHAFAYVLRSKKGEINFQTYPDISNALAMRSAGMRTVRYYGIPPSAKTSDSIVASRVLFEKNQRNAIRPLVESIKRITSDREDQARIAISLVQNIPYDSAFAKDMKSRSPFLPYNVLENEKGICEEKSDLVALIEQELGFGTALFTFGEENHMAFGIQCPIQYSYKNSGYAFVETTSPLMMTYSYGKYGGKTLNSEPGIIKLGTGNSMTSIFDDYIDAKSYYSLSSKPLLDDAHYNALKRIEVSYGMGKEIKTGGHQ